MGAGLADQGHGRYRPASRAVTFHPVFVRGCIVVLGALAIAAAFGVV